MTSKAAIGHGKVNRSATSVATVTPRRRARSRALATATGEKSKERTSRPCSASQTPLRPSPVGDRQRFLARLQQVGVLLQGIRSARYRTDSRARQNAFPAFEFRHHRLRDGAEEKQNHRASRRACGDRMTCPRYALKVLENATDGNACVERRLLCVATAAKSCGGRRPPSRMSAAGVICRSSVDREGLRRLLVPRGCFQRHGPPARPGLLPYGRLLGFAPARRFCLAHARSPCGSPGVSVPGLARRGIFHCRRRIVKAP